MRFDKNDSGASAVEFALIAPIFITVLMGAIEFSFVLYTYNAFEHVARQVGRRLATNSITVQQAEDSARNQLPHWVKSADVRVTPPNSTTPSNKLFTITISAMIKYTTPTNVLASIYGDSTLVSKTTFQQEPEV